MSRARSMLRLALGTSFVFVLGSAAAQAQAGPAAPPSRAEATSASPPGPPSAATQSAPEPAPGPAPGPEEGAGEPGATTAGDAPLQTIRAAALGVELVVHHFTLGNGLRVYVAEDHSVPAFALDLVYGVGSRDEVEGRTGFAHLFEHMMFKGSKNVPEGGQFKYVSGAGGELNAYTMTDFTLYYDVLPSHHLEAILWMEADRMRSLEVSDENFENQRSAVLEELAMRYENAPYAMAFTNFLGDVWQGTIYGHLPIGSKEDLLAASADDAREFFARHYVPNNAVLAIVGDVDPAQVRELVTRHFGDIPAGPAKPPIPPIDHAPTELVRTTVDPLAQQPVYVVGWKTVPEPHPDRPALELLFDILVRGNSSKIAKVLVDEKKLAIAAVPMSSGGGRDAGSEFAAFVPIPGVPPAQLLGIVREEIAKVKKSGVTTKDLQKAVNQRTVEAIERLATNAARAQAIATGALLEGDPAYVLADLQRYAAVTQADIKRVATQYLGEQTLQLEIQPQPR